MKRKASRPKLSLFLLVVLLTGLCGVLFNNRGVSAQELQNRSVRLSTTEVSVPASYNFQFSVPSTAVIGSIIFQYCDNSPLFAVACNAPAGLDVTAAAIVSQSGNSGFSVDNSDTTTNRLVINRVALAGAATATVFNFAGIINPAAAGQTIFVRIATHSSTDGTGTVGDSGAVAFVTSVALNVDAFVPPFLRLCVAIAVATDCSSTSGDRIDLGILSSGQASAGQSQFSTGSNSPTGYAIYNLGTTMTSGNNAIPALSSPTPSFAGNSQFGINLRANSNPPVGQEPAGSGVATPTTNYNQSNLFMFSNGDLIASSNIPSDYNRMTVSYLVNVNHAQPLGVYSTTMTYLAVAQF